MRDPYDELPYKSAPIEWTAPERLALASALHGGPRRDLSSYRVLELGAADGANLLPLAYHRPHARFVGVDSSGVAVGAAEADRVKLGLENIEFFQADVLDADHCLEGGFDFIISHGLFSWISEPARAAFLALCRRRLNPGGLLYLNYNAYPGWNIRGIVRRFLLERTATIERLPRRAAVARKLAIEWPPRWKPRIIRIRN